MSVPARRALLLTLAAASAASRESEAALGRSKLVRGTADMASNTSLRQLGEYYGTDKAMHTAFVDVYSEVLPRGDERTKLHYLLEIGVFFGASLKMWRDYYPSATIIGIDAFKGIEGYHTGRHHQSFRHPRAFLESWREGQQGSRIELIEADESVATEMDGALKLVCALLRNTSHRRAKGLDVLIDDGSHLQRNQQRNLGLLYPLIRPGGVYVVEDMHCSYLSGYDTRPYPSEDTTLALLERFNATGRFERSFHGVVTPQQARYLERWSQPPECYVPDGKKRDRALTCLLRKRESPKDSAQHSMTTSQLCRSTVEQSSSAATSQTRM